MTGRTAEALGTFLGSDGLPDRVAGGRAGALLDPRRPALPEPGLAAVLRHRRLVAHVRPHVPPLRHAVRLRLDREEHQRLRLHGRHPRRPGVRAEATEYEARYAPRVPRDPAYAGQIGAYLGWVLPALRRELPRLVARPPAAGDRAQLRAPRRLRHGSGVAARARDPARGRDRRPRPALEDPLDAQLRPVLLDHGAERDDRGGPRRGRPGAPGPPAVLRRGPQLGLDRGALEDEGGDQGRRRAARRLRGRRDRRRRRRARSRAPSAAGASSTERLAPAPAGVRLQGHLVARVRVQDVGREPGADHRGAPRLPRDRLRLPGQHPGRPRRPRARQGARSWRASRARRATGCRRRSTCRSA